MFTYLKAMEKRLTDDQRDMLTRIWEPTVVGTPLEDSRRDVCVLPDGEIRCYGHLYSNLVTGQTGEAAYLSSVDCGLSWQKHYAKGMMKSCTYFEKAGIYLASIDKKENEKGLFVYRSEIGPDDQNPAVIKVSDEELCDSFLPIGSMFSDRVWFTAQKNDVKKTICFFFSDDFGLSWQTRTVTPPPAFEMEFPHKGLRWCKGNGTEPYVAELSENELMMIIRSSTDCFWKCYSHDGGDTWSEPERSTFYGTNTTAFLLRLTDGRLLSFWNNTKPLPEVDHSTTLPPVSQGVKDGLWEDVFTNRDAAHAAISEDGGKNWIGYREILLNSIRNNADFRYNGADKSTRDKSVHQFQAFELPFNKVLVSVGQNNASRRLVIFDIGWLYETARENNLLNGTANLTTHTYVKSVSGSHFNTLGNGHCAWNRTYSAYMMPDPEGGVFEVLSISKHHDGRLVSDIGGACWNFPNSRQGKVSVEMKLADKQARFILTDRWYNACDEYALTLSPFGFELDAHDVKDGYFTLDIEYNTDQGIASVSVEGESLFKVEMQGLCPTGISYLIMQCATYGDSDGFYIKNLKKE